MPALCCWSTAFLCSATTCRHHSGKLASVHGGRELRCGSSQKPATGSDREGPQTTPKSGCRWSSRTPRFWRTAAVRVLHVRIVARLRARIGVIPYPARGSGFTSLRVFKCVCALIGPRCSAMPQQRREHLLQSGNQNVYLLSALGLLLDLIVFDGNFRSEKNDLAVFLVEPLFELRNVRRIVRVRSRLLLVSHRVV